MRKILVTGGTVFVSRYVANYFAQKGDNVYTVSAFFFCSRDSIDLKATVLLSEARCGLERIDTIVLIILSIK